MIIAVVFAAFLAGAVGGFVLAKRASTWCIDCGRVAHTPELKVSVHDQAHAAN
ncbi:hypothetical protein AB0368_33395 [Actinoplanes sp. NPDC051475]|uniref:hypothetical protein n=1 Tax=Actinoplanes sp. NPDC051475 TaxID=3157225 RepID=UPI00344CF3A8